MNTFSKLIEFIKNIKSTIMGVLGTIWGWAMNVMVYIAITFGGNAHLAHWILIALLGDLFLGSWSAIKRKKFHISYALQETAVKVVLYITLFFMPLILDIMIPLDLSYVTIAIAALLVSAEFFSMIAHILVIKPDLVGAQFIGRLLEVEISHKLDLDPNDVKRLFRKEKEENL